MHLVNVAVCSGQQNLPALEFRENLIHGLFSS